jgi:hypothetical protein
MIQEPNNDSGKRPFIRPAIYNNTKLTPRNDVMAPGAIKPAGESLGAGFSFYKPGISHLSPSANMGFEGVILPSFDRTMSMHDTSFMSSVGSYRAWEVDDSVDAAGNSMLHGFFAYLSTHTFLGFNKAKMLSPLSLRYLDPSAANEDIVDPVKDILDFASSSTVAEWAGVKNLKDSDDNRIIRYPTRRGFFNMFGGSPGNAWEVFMIDVSGKACEHLLDQLNYPSTGSGFRDPTWPQYLLGDITKPERALVCRICNMVHPDSYTFNGFMFQGISAPGGEINTLTNIREHVVTESVLKKRQFLDGLDSGFRVMKYQEIVDYLIADGAVPLELIKRACGHLANVQGKEFKTGASVVSSPPASVSHAPLPPAPTRPVPSPMPVHTATPIQSVTPVEDVMWFALVSAPQDLQQKTRSELQRLVDSGVSLMVYIDSEGAWHREYELERYGFTIHRAKQPPPPPALISGAEPEPPATYIPPEVWSGGVSASQPSVMETPVIPKDPEIGVDAQQQRLEELKARFANVDIKVPMQAADLSDYAEMLSLMEKIGR